MSCAFSLRRENDDRSWKSSRKALEAALAVYGIRELQAISATNSPSKLRQDYYARSPGFGECSLSLIRAGVEPRVAKGFKSVNLIEHLEYNKLWNSTGLVSCFSYVSRTAKSCRGGMCGKGRLIYSNAAYFWEDYCAVADEVRFKSDIRAIWRLIHTNNEVLMAFHPKLATLMTRDMLTPAMSVETLPAFTTLYIEMLHEVICCRLIPRKYRLAYRNFVLRYVGSDFFSSPCCRCCNRVYCTSRLLRQMLDAGDAAAGQAGMKEVASLFDPEGVILSGTTVTLSNPRSSRDVEEGSARKAGSEIAGPAVNESDSLVSSYFGDPPPPPRKALFHAPATRFLKALSRALDRLTLYCLESLFTSLPFREILVNDFLVQDLRVLRDNFGLDIWKIYRTEGYRGLINAFSKELKGGCGEAQERKRGTRYIRNMSFSLMREFIYSVHLRRSGTNPEEDWSYGCLSEDEPHGPAHTVAQKYWLSVWRVIERNIQNREKLSAVEERLSPSFLVNPVSETAPVVAEWLRFIFEICAINKMYFEGGLAVIESFLSQLCFLILELKKHQWPPSVLKDYEEVVCEMLLKDDTVSFFDSA